MNISVRLNKNFTTAYNKMLEDYGEEIAKKRMEQLAKEAIENAGD